MLSVSVSISKNNPAIHCLINFLIIYNFSKKNCPRPRPRANKYLRG